MLDIFLQDKDKLQGLRSWLSELAIDRGIIHCSQSSSTKQLFHNCYRTEAATIRHKKQMHNECNAQNNDRQNAVQ